MGDLLRRASRGGQRVDLARTIHLVDLCCDLARLGERVAVDHHPPADRARHFAAGDSDATNVLSAVIVGYEVETLAVRGEANLVDVTIQRAGQDFGFPTGRGGDSKVLSGVFEELRLGLRDVGD